MEKPSSLARSAWALTFEHWRPLAAIAIIPAAVRAVANLFAPTLIGLPISLLLGLLSAVLSVAMYPALIDAIRSLAADPNTALSVKDQYKLGFSMFWSFLLVMVIQVLTGFGSLVLLVIPGIVMAVYSCSYAFARIIDDKRGLTAFTASYALVHGRWRPVFWRLIFLGAISAPFFLAVLLVSIPLTLSIGIIWPILAGPLVYAFFVPFVFSYMYLLYANLKSTQTGEVPAATFKKWLVAFMVIGAILPFVLAVIGILAGFGQIR